MKKHYTRAAGAAKASEASRKPDERANSVLVELRGAESRIYRQNAATQITRGGRFLARGVPRSGSHSRSFSR